MIKRTLGYRLKLFLVAAVALIGGYFVGHLFSKPDLGEVGAVMMPKPIAIQPFKLTDFNGQPFTLHSLKGHWSFVFFGYTHCPDVCPLALSDMARTYNRLADDPKLQGNTEFVFISVDPKRDTPKQLKEFVGYFNPEFLAATGSDEELTKLAKQMFVVYLRDDASGEENYDVAHSANISLIDPDGNFVAAFKGKHDPKAIAADFKKIVKQWEWSHDTFF
ncbi:MAG TPA: SCO family protein [Chromatiaceae bacterium]|nr:SCO family protein [Chromatiaceae bacterium]